MICLATEQGTHWEVLRAEDSHDVLVCNEGISSMNWKPMFHIVQCWGEIYQNNNKSGQNVFKKDSENQGDVTALVTNLSPRFNKDGFKSINIA